VTGHLDLPVHVDGRGRLGVTAGDDHIGDLIRQVLFTNPGERVNRPDFGCGLLQLVFLPNSEPLAIATQFTVKSALQKWLGDVIQVDDVEVTAVESTLRVRVAYRRILDGVEETATFQQPIPD
jgi:uncharacterized protein